jgi:hypothetical protein
MSLARRRTSPRNSVECSAVFVLAYEERMIPRIIWVIPPLERERA